MTSPDFDARARISELKERGQPPAGNGGVSVQNAGTVPPSARRAAAGAPLNPGNPACPVCEGRGYFFGQRTPRCREVRYYCDCEANIRESEVTEDEKRDATADNDAWRSGNA